jgi:glycosyltransferase involved in cell wall biosynthesis
MIYLNLPVGGAHGWGVCGKMVAREIGRLRGPGVRLLTEPFTPAWIGSPTDFVALREMLPTAAESARFGGAGGGAAVTLDGPLLQLADNQLRPKTPGLRGTFTLGYTFAEGTELPPAYVENAKHFDRLAAGSTWAAEILTRHGIADVATVLQGVDPAVFFPRPDWHRPVLRDRFIVFSGGKFEFRKGQDIVIRAFKVLRDVLLIASWFNQWPATFATMRQSPHIRFEPSRMDGLGNVGEVLAQNGIAETDAILLNPLAPAELANVYRHTDVGIFPNRAEGGTNLMLMEYMACGRPVIATAATGHADVIDADVARVIGTAGEVTSSHDGTAVARWPEPDLEQAIEQLEWAYQNRDALAPLGHRAAVAIAQLTWTRTAEQFLSLLP